MRYILILIGISLFFLIGCNKEQPDLFLENPPQTGDWQLTFEDNFDGNQFDAPSPIKWETQNYNRRNNELGPDGWWSENDVYLGGDGNLVIRVEQIQNSNNDSNPFDYSVGMVRSKGKLKIKYENSLCARLKM